MSRVCRMVVLLFAVAWIGTSFEIAAQDKKDKKDDKKDPIKEEKKEPFKPDPALTEFKYLEKDKMYWATAVAFGDDGKLLAASYRPHTVVIWDVPNKKDSKVIKGPEQRGLGEFKGLMFHNGLIYVGTGQLNKKKEKPKEAVKDKPKEKEKIDDTPLRKGEIKAWNAKTGAESKPLFGHIDNIEALAVSPDGKFLASGSKDNTVNIWNMDDKKTQTIKGHTDDVTGVAFSPDGKQLVTTSLDRTVRVWDIADAKEIAQFKVELTVEKKDPKGKVTQVKELGRDFTHAVFTGDGKRIIAANRDGLIKIYDVADQKEVQELKAHDGVLALALSPDGSKFATGGYDQCIKIWETATGKELRTIKAHLGPVLTVAFSPDNRWLASGSTDGTVKIWSVK